MPSHPVLSALPTTVTTAADPLVLDASLALGGAIRRCFSGREAARQLADVLPEGPVLLDFRAVRECTPSFFVELLTLRPGVHPIKLSADGEASWRVACCRCAALHGRMERRV